jgi:FkbM family methyltransferase
MTMDLNQYETIQPWAENEGIKFFTPSNHVLWRVKTLLTKEPDTIAWINNMQPGDTFLDVGANIGQYSLFAAARGLKVFAFEPESQNFALLCRNIVLNDQSANVVAYPVCVSDKSKLDILHLSGMIPGGSCHSFGESLNYQGQPKDFPARQGSISITLDEFILTTYPNYPTSPIHLKIDVDGFEHQVIDGLGDSINYITSTSIELNTRYPEHMNIVTYLLDHGFTYSETQASMSRRKEGPFEGIGNIQFYRNS